MSTPKSRVAEFVELKSPDDRLPTLFTLVERHYELGETVLIYTSDPADAERLDTFLWTCRQGSFIPHVRLDEAQEPIIEPVLIAVSEPLETAADALIVAAAEELPAGFERFAHAYDFAPIYDEARRTAARRRYAAFQETGCRMRFIPAQTAR